MKEITPNVMLIVGAALVLWMPIRPAHAQRTDRLSTAFDPHNRIKVADSRSAFIKGLRSAGPAEGSMPVPGIRFRFRPTAKQQAELEQLLEAQQDPSAPEYHSWLTPEEYAERFGLGSGDLSYVREWIEAQGFTVDDVAKSRTFITFSGTAEQVRRTFGSEIHRFSVNGTMHYANVSDIELPAGLEQLVYTVHGLDDFHPGPSLAGRPQARMGDGGNAIGPGDMAVIYNLKPILDKGINGAGQKIVVAGQSNFKIADIQQFRAKYNLPQLDPRVILVPGSADPGFTDSQVEANLMLEYAGASAPNATLIYVNAAQYIHAVEHAIDQNLAPIIVASFGVCEVNVAKVQGAAEEFRNIAQHANALGITWIASSGDTGPAACEVQLQDPAGVSGISMNVPASVPEVTGVGGTSFNEGTGTYWNADASTASTSARSYIPEIAWNDTALDGTLAASSGGPSKIYTRPVWQNGPGVPAANARHVPDVAFAASWDHDPYLIVLDGLLRKAGGSSVAAPYLAGVLALLNQYVVTSGAQTKVGLGNINPRLYELAQTVPGVFHDVVAGDNIIPCKAKSPDCNGASYGFKAGPGYDQVTGLGSIDFKNLFDNWAKPASNRVITTLSLVSTPASLLDNSSATLTVTVKAASGTVSPTGSVAFSAGKTALGSANLEGSGGVATASLAFKAVSLALGSNTVTANYSGSTRFAASTGSATVTVQASNANVVGSVEPSPVYRQTRDDEGYEWFYTVRLSEIAGVGATIKSLHYDDYDLSNYISAWFGGAKLPANGSVAVDLRSKDLYVPADHVFTFAGIDDGGHSWSRQVSAQFRDRKVGAALSLISTPSVVVKIGKGDSHCAPDHPYYQQLTVKELNGGDVKLTRFLAGGNDYTSQIPVWFSSVQLPGSGSLRADLCWQLDSVPVTLQYEIAGLDNSGKEVVATLAVGFKSFDEKSGAVSLSGVAPVLEESPRGIDVVPAVTIEDGGSEPAGTSSVERQRRSAPPAMWRRR